MRKSKTNPETATKEEDSSISFSNCNEEDKVYHDNRSSIIVSSASITLLFGDKAKSVVNTISLS